MKKWILQVKSGAEYETLEVYEDGRIICSCINNLYNKDREVNSYCRHATELRDNIFKGELKKYIWIQ